MDDLRYPVGKFHFPKSVSPQELSGFIDRIAETPSKLRAALAGLSDSQLDTPYRPEGWTVRQVAHHVPDSHMNSYVRFRLALTEDEPVIKPYEENRWAELPDARAMPVEPSLDLLESLHTTARWVPLLPIAFRSLNGNAASAILNWAWSAWKTMPRFTPGTDAITWRTSPHCASEWAGNHVWRTHSCVPRSQACERVRDFSQSWCPQTANPVIMTPRKRIAQNR